MDTIKYESFKPEPFVVNRKEWIVCDGTCPSDPTFDCRDIKGLAVLVNTSVSNAEQSELLRAYNQAVDDFRAWLKQDPDERDGESPLVRQRELIAPYVADWNARAETIDGELVELAPPAVNGAAAFAVVHDDVAIWIIKTVLNGYLNTGKARPSPKRSGPTGSTDAAPEPEPEAGDPSPPPN